MGEFLIIFNQTPSEWLKIMKLNIFLSNLGI